MNEPSCPQRVLRRIVRPLQGVLLATSATLAILTGSMDPAWAMDTDIFAATTSSATAPNVLIILDNTSNWSRQNQHFPGGITQGQAEADAIKKAISRLPGNINIGVMEYPTGGRNDTGGFIRFAVSPMGSGDGATGAANFSSLTTILTSVFNNINDPTEKVNSGQAYGDLMYDAYNYFAGLTPFATPADVLPSKADSNGYVTNYTKFKSPLSSTGNCGSTYIIFIGNPNASGPIADSPANKAALQALGGDTTQLKLPNFSLKTQTISDNLGYSTSCYTSQPSAVESAFATACSGYDSCSYDANNKITALDACPTGTARYSVNQTTPVVTGSTTTTTTVNTGKTNSCYAAPASWSSSSDAGTVPSCPIGSTTTSGGTTTSTSYSCSYAISSTGATSCGTQTSTGATQTTTAESSSCYSNLNQWSSSDKGTLSCPATTTTTSNGVTTTTTYSCTYSGSLSGSTASCGSNKQHVVVTQTATPTSSWQTYKYPLTQTVTKTVTTGTITGYDTTTLGNTLSCYSSQTSCSTSDYICPQGSTCACSTPTTTTGVCPAGNRYQVQGNYAMNLETPVSPPTYSTDTATYNADEWARFMHDVGVPVGSSKQPVNVYTIDVYNAQPDALQSSLLASMARAGGGKYFAATTESAILSALNTIFSEINAKNNTFASAALPISATNRAQNSNQVYIGMFRPDQGAHPRWFGNLKRYQVANIDGFDGLAGANGKAAVSNTTGFITPCGVSWWTTDSVNYWYDTTRTYPGIFITQALAGSAGTAWDAAGNDDEFAKGTCQDFTNAWSDYPDGPTVEKGGAAQVLRNGLANRKLYTVAMATTGAASLLTFDTSISGLSSNSTINTNVVNFIKGQDVTGEINLAGSSVARPSIHGDVIHSRPLPVDHGAGTGVVIYYGAGDGVYHAVKGSDGSELWGFVAPETYSSLQRLMDNTPLVLTPNPPPPGTSAIPGNTGRDFFFDGSTGLYQNAANTKVWIYPAMRRGGRMLYAFDVSTPTAPTLKWRRGCPNPSNDTDCTAGMSGIGQTWSTPQVAKVNGYTVSGTKAPVIIVGAGYDTCEDADSTSPSCSSPKGAAVYVLDADTGALLATFPTSRSVAADVALIDTNADGIVDAAYAADTGGNVYRIDFPIDATDASKWKMTKVAYTSGASRKFLFAPGLLPYKGKVYVAIVSGDREHPLAASYPYTTPVLNRAYVYLDDPARTDPTDLDGIKMMNKVSTGPTCDSPKVLPDGDFYGWHMDLTGGGAVPSLPGEQGVTSALIFGGMVTFSTNRPTGPNETCTTALGEARGYFVNLLNGSGAIGVAGTCGGQTSSVFPGGGLPPSAVAATVNVDGKEQTILIGAPCKDGTSCAPIQAQQINPPISSKRNRTYWKTNVDNR